MYTDFEHISWNDIQDKLKQKYPFLTNADLRWRNSTKKDLLNIIALKLGITNKELQEIFKES
jgi:hypothetical protein